MAAIVGLMFSDNPYSTYIDLINLQLCYLFYQVRMRHNRSLFIIKKIPVSVAVTEEQELAGNIIPVFE